MYRVNNLLFVHTIFACIFGVKLKNFPGGYAPLTPIFSGGLHPPEPLALSFGKPLSKFLATPLTYIRSYMHMKTKLTIKTSYIAPLE